MRRRGVAVVLGLLAAAGCWNFGSVSDGPGDGGAEGGGGQDASTVRTSDGGTSVSDATTDQGGQKEAAPSAPFCDSFSPAPTLCDDFDEEETLSLAQWDKANQIGGTVGLTSNSYAGAYAMTAQMPILTAQEYALADLQKAFSNYANQAVSVSASFMMNVTRWDTASTGQNIAYEVIFQNSANQYNQIVLNLVSLGPGGGGVSAQITENIDFGDGGITSFSYPLSVHPKTNGWTEVEMNVIVHNPNGTDQNTVTISFDGVPQLGANGHALQLPIQGGIPTVHLGIGYVYSPTTSPWAVDYDNFAVNFSLLQ